MYPYQATKSPSLSTPQCHIQAFFGSMLFVLVGATVVQQAAVLLLDLHKYKRA